MHMAVEEEPRQPVGDDNIGAISSRPWRKYDVDGDDFELPPHLVPPLKRCGDGTYGLVCSCFDTDRHAFVAVKKIHGIFREKSLKRPLCAVREIEILLHNRRYSNDNVQLAASGGTNRTDGESRDAQDAPLLYALEVYCSPHATVSTLDDVYIVTPLYSFDLHTMICQQRRLRQIPAAGGDQQPLPQSSSSTRRISLTLDIARTVCRQLLTSIDMLHDSGVIHGDVKPSNVLFPFNYCSNDGGACCLADFGLSQPQPESGQTPYRTVVTNYYRPPELFLGNATYGTEIDMWSYGCLVAELFLCRPLFPFADHAPNTDHLRCIAEHLGISPASAIHNPVARKCLLALPPRSKTIQELIPRDGCAFAFAHGAEDDDQHYEQFIDFVKRCLDVCPQTRATAKEMLHHPFLADITVEAAGIQKEEEEAGVAADTQVARSQQQNRDPMPCAFSDITDAQSARSRLWALANHQQTSTEG